MDLMTQYSNELEALLKEDEELFKISLLCRFIGEDGPPLGNDREWTNILSFAFSCASEELKPKWGEIVLRILNDFAYGNIFEVSKGGDNLKCFFGALDLANSITLQKDHELRLKAILSSWFEYVSDERFPGPYDLWEKEGFRGQYDNDVLTVILRLSARKLIWRTEAERIWNGEYPLQRHVPEKITASRSKEIAMWAIAQNQIEWLGKNMEEFMNRLEKAQWYAGNMFNFFFQIEMDYGKEKVEDIISKVVLPRDYKKREHMESLLNYFVNIGNQNKRVTELIKPQMESKKQRYFNKEDYRKNLKLA